MCIVLSADIPLFYSPQVTMQAVVKDSQTSSGFGLPGQDAGSNFSGPTR